jgi:hypothetical protein
LCTISKASKLVDIVEKFGSALLSVIKTLIRTMETGSSCECGSLPFVKEMLCKAHNFQLDRIASIVKSARSQTADTHCEFILAVQLGDWQGDVGPQALEALRDICDASIKALNATTLPSTGFVPTLKHLHTIPPPTWTYVPNVDVPLEAARARLPPVNQRISSISDVKIPEETMLTLRLISVVWELSACNETNEAYFTQGRVLTSAARQVTYMHYVSACFALTVLKDRLQQHLIGKNYRNAVKRMSVFKGSEFENDMRLAVQCVSRWSVQELMSVCSETSPMFRANLFRVMDATLFNMVTKPSLTSAAIIVRALLTARPILIELRSEAGIDRRQPSSETIDMLMSIPAIREWDRSGSELVLTHGDVSLGLHGTTEMLKRMSAERRVVNYRRIKSKWVYTFNCSDLAKLLR